MTAVVVNHFHADCLGGLGEFHRRGITPYASKRTLELAGLDGMEVPKKSFNQRIELMVGDRKVYNEYFGEGHTTDNIVSYLPDEKVLFGGCLIKSVGAGKGYLGDANVSAWSETVQKVKAKYPLAEVIIPGHGKRGGQELFDFTIQLFQGEGE